MLAASTYLGIVGALRLPAGVRMDGAAAVPQKVTVLGGTGFTGSRVCRELVARGAAVTAVSRRGEVPEWCAAEPWAAEVEWVGCGDYTRGPREALAQAVGSPDAVVSAVGAVGFDRQGLMLGNGVANVELVAAAQAVGARRYVYVSVSQELADCQARWLPGVWGLSGYFEGKAAAEAAVRAAAAAAAAAGGGGATIVKPSFIYGGDAFGLFPPRVASW